MHPRRSVVLVDGNTRSARLRFGTSLRCGLCGIAVVCGTLLRTEVGMLFSESLIKHFVVAFVKDVAVLLRAEARAELLVRQNLLQSW